MNNMLVTLNAFVLCLSMASLAGASQVPTDTCTQMKNQSSIDEIYAMARDAFGDWTVLCSAGETEIYECLTVCDYEEAFGGLVGGAGCFVIPRGAMNEAYIDNLVDTLNLDLCIVPQPTPDSDLSSVNSQSALSVIAVDCGEESISNCEYDVEMAVKGFYAT